MLLKKNRQKEKGDTLIKSEEWGLICQLHGLTKHYLLIAEELCDNGKTFIQPLKEHRDAYDHIIRIFGVQFAETQPQNINKYVANNLSKAIGHEYRAFYDVADWLTLICRKGIRQCLENYNINIIEQKYPDYKDIKSKILDLSVQIAKLREDKDIAKDASNDIFEKVKGYCKILDTLIKAYIDITEIFQDGN